jgi:hypothetical protein
MLLRTFAPGRETELQQLVERLQPTFQLDTTEERILFQADSATNTITLGLEGSRRLQAHAYAAAIFVTALSTPGYLNLEPEERDRLYAPADPMLSWAVGRDLQQRLRQNGVDGDLVEIMGQAVCELPKGLLSSLTANQRILGEGVFRIACAFIILHELAHLHFRHCRCQGDASIHQEKDADRFAAAWLLECPGITAANRMSCLLGISIALIWLCVFDIYLGPSQSDTHPPPHDRLFQILDQFIDPTSDDERLLIWDFVSRILVVHLDNAAIEIDWQHMHGLPRERADYLLNLFSKHQR